MKYIRTKDTIIKHNPKERLFNDVGLHIFTANLSDPNYLKIPEYMYYEKDIVAKSKTIKELCDEFVVIGYKMKNPFIFSKEGISIDEFWKHSPSDTIVYGAIWTEWGLKYVAKMNEKGELELL